MVLWLLYHGSFEPNKTEMQEKGLINFPLGGLELLKMILCI